MSDIFAHDALDAVLTACQAERTAFRHSGDGRSPACIEIFRRAFTADQDAWVAVYVVFEPQLNRHAQQIVNSLLRDEMVEPEDIVQEAFAAFARAAPKQPSLVDGDHLGPLVRYLQTCIKTAVLQRVRTAMRQRYRYLDARLDADPSVVRDDAGETRQAILARVRELAHPVDERIVGEARFIYNMKPHEIQAMYQDRFPDAASVSVIVQRLVRRYRKDPVLRQLFDDLAE